MITKSIGIHRFHSPYFIFNYVCVGTVFNVGMPIGFQYLFIDLFEFLLLPPGEHPASMWT